VKIKSTNAKIEVCGTEITVIRREGEDYISLTDMLKAKDGEFFISDWLRNRNTLRPPRHRFRVWDVDQPRVQNLPHQGIPAAQGGRKPPPLPRLEPQPHPREDQLRANLRHLRLTNSLARETDKALREILKKIGN
jgi:hypothetical protein